MSNKTKRSNYIAEVRRSRGKTQQELADLMGVSLTTINRYENGSRGTDPDTIATIARVLEVQPHTLFVKPKEG